MTGPRRKNAAQRDMMSVYPPRSVGPALGGYRSVPFSTALRVAANILGEANLEAGKKLTAREWEFVYKSLRERGIDPDVPRPGGYLAEIVNMRQAHFGAGAELDQKNPAAAVTQLANKLAELSYLQAWAVIISCKWREENEPDEAGTDWWTIRYRASKSDQ